VLTPAWRAGKRAAEAASALVPRAAHTHMVHTRPEVGSGQVGSQDVPAGQEGGPRRARTDDLRIERAIKRCGESRIPLICSVIRSQPLVSFGAVLNPSADYLRTAAQMGRRAHSVGTRGDTVNVGVSGLVVAQPF
jgi:hypothetical protein